MGATHLTRAGSRERVATGSCYWDLTGRKWEPARRRLRAKTGTLTTAAGESGRGHRRVEMQIYAPYAVLFCISPHPSRSLADRDAACPYSTIPTLCDSLVRRPLASTVLGDCGLAGSRSSADAD